MNILVTGAAGFLGTILTRRFLAEGHHCRCLLRKKNHVQKLPETNNISFFYGDISEEKSLHGICENIDVVCHLASLMGHVGTLSPTRKIKDKFYQINVAGVKNISREARMAKIKKFIYISSTAAMGLIANVTADEKTPCQPATLYQKTKYEAEAYLLNLFREENFPVVVLRPSVFLGPGYVGDLVKLAKFIKKGFFLQIGNGLNLTPFIHVRDVVEGIISAIDKANPGQIYILTSEQSYPLREIAALAAKELNKTYQVIYLSTGLAIFLSAISEIARRLLHTPNVITRESIRSIVTDRIFSIEKAKRELDFHPKIPIEKGIKETLNWSQENGYL